MKDVSPSKQILRNYVLDQMLKITNGWKPFGRDYVGCTDEDFRDDWEMEMKLYNQKKKNSGILYTVSYNKS